MPGVSDDWFAEHMLPEGAHNHSLDWTVMFLNRDKVAVDEDWPPQVVDVDDGKSDRTASTVRDRYRLQAGVIQLHPGHECLSL